MTEGGTEEARKGTVRRRLSRVAGVEPWLRFATARPPPESQLQELVTS